MGTVNRNDFRMLHRLRVRWAEIDLQRIVFNPHYLTYVDTAFTEYWRAIGIPYEVIPAQLGGDLYVKKSTLEYHGSARLDDMLEVGVKNQRIGNSSLDFLAGIFRDGKLLVDCQLLYVFADPLTQTARPVPAVLRALFTAFEAGEPVLDWRQGSWNELGAAAGPLRRAVLMDEMKITAALDQDAGDGAAGHVLAANRLGQALATGHISSADRGAWQIGRVAVIRTMRGTGLGRSVVEKLMKMAQERGASTVVVSSLVAARGFYERLGFRTASAPYLDGAVEHIDMARKVGAAPPPV
ncbi:MAG: YbgC/FadM family acyl-CoA thioesterase [Rhodoferax sp.]|nr:YbgC/FadM family acyl-CoA thioesterase [Rhodoferax sp.]